MGSATEEQPTNSVMNGRAKGRRTRRPLSQWFKFRRDYRASLPPMLQRFTGYRPPGAHAPFQPIPIPPFTWLAKLPLKYEIYLTAWIGSFVGILLIEAIMSTNTAFRDAYHTPIVITSFGASAVLLFGVNEFPVAQPRNFVGGHFVSALVGTCITRLFVLNPKYQGYLENSQFHPSIFINGGVSMATSLLAMQITGTVHPPCGATGLNAAVESRVVTLSWHYLPIVLASSLIMLGWAVIINNLGRRRYPVYWWTPGRTFVVDPDLEHDETLRAVEEAEEEEEEEQVKQQGELALANLESDSRERNESTRGSRGSGPTSLGR